MPCLSVHAVVTLTAEMEVALCGARRAVTKLVTGLAGYSALEEFLRFALFTQCTRLQPN
jgi:hypothetical protein